VHETSLTFGKAIVFYPEATAARCEAALTLDIDPVGLVRGRGAGDGLLDQYVNDRPYAATSFLSVALNRTYRTAMTGVSRERPELAARAIPLEIVVTPLPTRGGDDFVHALFEPLGWAVSSDRIDGPTGASRYVTLRLTGTMRLADALAHLYVLIPVLDADKHYWVGDDEVEKLLEKGGNWLAAHPEKERIALRYLKNRRSLARTALARLVEEDVDRELEPSAERGDGEEALEKPIRLNEVRLDAVVEALVATGATSVADLGCGEGKLLRRLVRDRRFSRLIGLDVSTRALERAAENLKLDLPGGISRERLTLLHGALTYSDDRWRDADAAILMEVIEHIDIDRLPMLAKVIFGAAQPKIVIVTTPNIEHNALFPNLRAGAFRHPDHRFEWTREQMRAWVAAIEAEFGYSASISGIGPEHPSHGSATQMAVFTR
jgi:3' terminal RNA ribose 2'-O-methyltransferase Hen1